ncbi:hypothetical protein [Sinorhizobium sp. BG8]|uniref:hypothetical protein n=1 Tax=Sinorhizobium sp. BG8 TaxID=2613773 RepID=UPI00193DCEDD|nr:hypothetical protein [Sinorhizobium sp. BG8]QRM54317.1 hypothetical protein F3Y30_06935 [Sinorhizobium sp. BG8]
MEHIAAIMILVGCSGTSTACTELPAPQAVFETMEDCNGALATAIGAAGGKARIVRAKCASIDPAWEEEDVQISWDITRNGQLDITVTNAADDPTAFEYDIAGR